MDDEKIDLQWGKFAWQLFICLIALAGGIHASLHFFTAEETRIAFAKTDLGLIIGVFLVMGTAYFALWILRVPYKNDMFERRLRNWSMTYAAILVFMFSAALNIALQINDKGALITPYMMIGAWLVCYIIYSQYTRYCIASGRKNSFLDGNSC